MARAAPEAAPAVAFDREVDARGLSCPWPALQARVALKGMKRGQVLRVLATDREAPRDFERFARATGNALVGQGVRGKDFVFYLRKR